MKLLETSEHKLSWGEIYYGLKKDYISINFIFDNYDKNKICLFSEDRYIELLLAFEENNFEILKIVKKYIYDDDKIYLDHNEVEFIETRSFEYIPENYRKFLDDLYELEIIEEIIKSQNSILEKFYNLYLNHSSVNHKNEWKIFIDFYFNGSTNLDEDKLYRDLKAYYNDLRKKCGVRSD